MDSPVVSEDEESLVEPSCSPLSLSLFIFLVLFF